jgi:KipI family sensor histidine kinase inhibitor
MTMRCLPVGDRAVLVEVDSLTDVHRFNRAVQSAGIGVDSIPAWGTLLVTTDGDVGTLMSQLRDLSWENSEPLQESRMHEIPVVYDGEDLAAVAQACGLSEAEVVRLHGSTEYVVAFLGFSRGFPYLSGLPEALRLPRRSPPRTKVPAGSVAIAFDQCGVYPMATPGGWHLLGRTDRQLFDPEREPPSELSSGDRVRFVDVGRPE